MHGLYLSVKQSNGSKQSLYPWGRIGRSSSARVVDAALRKAAKVSTKASARGELVVGLLQQLSRQAVRHLQI